MSEAKPQCGGGASMAEEEYDLGLHVGAVFMVLAASIFGAGFPVAAKKLSWLKIPDPVFFACKHFGTGVLVATAFVHLLPVAFASLTDPCLPELFTDIYPAIPGAIMMVSMFALFVIEMYLTTKTGGHSHGGPVGQDFVAKQRPGTPDSDLTLHVDSDGYDEKPSKRELEGDRSQMEKNFLDVSSMTGQPMPAWFVVFYEQYIRQREDMMQMIKETSPQNYRKNVPTVDVVEHFDQEGQTPDPQILRKMNLNITLLEGGILFHSIFVGITVSLTTEGFVILLVAIMFHQMFEGVGLGSRIASVPYPRGSIRPWVLVAAFGLTAPIGQAIGLAARGSYDPDSAYGLIIVGVFNAMSSGLLVYAALVDLLAEDFLSEDSMRVLKGKTRVEAFLWVIFGAIAMSVIGAFA